MSENTSALSSPKPRLDAFDALLQQYSRLCQPRNAISSVSSDARDKTAPVYTSQAVRSCLKNGEPLAQLALLGHLEETSTTSNTPSIYEDAADDFAASAAPADVVHNTGSLPLNHLLLNTNAPWSAFICGSQGSGKSYTTSCMLEGLLLQDSRIGNLDKAASGMVFHYDRIGSTRPKPCEIASLCSTGIKVKVLVSPSNEDAMVETYRKAYPAEFGKTLTVQCLYLRSADLNSERIQKFMASKVGGEKPLYMSLLETILRDMGRAQQTRNGHVGGHYGFDYAAFRQFLEEAPLTEMQRPSLDQRLSCLESFFAGPKTTISRTDHMGRDRSIQARQIDDTIEDMLRGEAGCLAIVDVTDSTYDSSIACGLFNLCLAAFIDRTEGPKVVALDEAHNYLSKGDSSDAFTEDLLKVIREQRHTGSRVIVATQEPTLSTSFLDLCSMTIVHRFTSPDWFRVLRSHLGGASAEAGVSETTACELFRTIGNLEAGESMFFCPTGLVVREDGEIGSQSFEHKILKTRLRLSKDAGKSRMAQD